MLLRHSYLFGPRRDDVRGKWRTLNKAESRKLYFLGRSMRYVWETAEVCTGVWWRDVRKGDRLEDLGLHGKITLKRNFEKCGMVGVDWTDLAEDRDRWRALVDVVKTFGLRKMRPIS